MVTRFFLQVKRSHNDKFLKLKERTKTYTSKLCYRIKITKQNLSRKQFTC